MSLSFKFHRNLCTNAHTQVVNVRAQTREKIQTFRRCLRKYFRIEEIYDIGFVNLFYDFWIQVSHHFYDFWIQKFFSQFLQFLDPETAVFLPFLDSENALFLDREICWSICPMSGSRKDSIFAVSGSWNWTISTVSRSKNILIPFQDFWIQKPGSFCIFWIQKPQSFCIFWIQKLQLHHLCNFWVVIQ